MKDETTEEYVDAALDRIWDHLFITPENCLRKAEKDMKRLDELKNSGLMINFKRVKDGDYHPSKGEVVNLIEFLKEGFLSCEDK